MSRASTIARAQPEPLPENIQSAQPGGGFYYRLELAWGRVRRGYLRTFRRGYLQRMAAKRQGACPGCPHDVLDPRDLKFSRVRCGFYWERPDDPFAWRRRLPFAYWGLAELQLMGWPLLAVAVVLAFTPVWYLAAIPALLLAEVVWFFRDPHRHVPQAPGLVVSPADGKVVEVTRLEHAEFAGGPAVRIGIFLSVFNVHVNRWPLEGKCIRLRYAPGRFLNALNPASAVENEAMEIALEEEEAPHRRVVVRQIAGAIARRIVCDVKPGEVLRRGERFGMIKLGSRTEIVLPDDGTLRVEARVGDKVRGGASVVARYVQETGV